MFWVPKEIWGWRILAFSDLCFWGFDLILAARWLAEGKGVAPRTRASFIYSFFSHSLRDYSLTCCSAQDAGVLSYALKSESPDYSTVPGLTHGALFFIVEREMDCAFSSLTVTRITGWVSGSSNRLRTHETKYVNAGVWHTKFSSLGAAPGHVPMTSDAHGKVVLGWWDGYPFVPLHRALLPQSWIIVKKTSFAKGAGS